MKPENIELCDKIVAGIRKAAQKLIEKSAANNESLVYGINGEIVRIPAKELLKNPSK